MTRSSKTRRKPESQAPQGRQSGLLPRWRWGLIGVAVIAVVAVVVGVSLTRSNGDSAGSTSAGAETSGLPNTPDYHSLAVDRSNPKGLLLGTHQGLFRSADGGRSWRFEGLSGQDAMNLAQPSGRTLWTAGHYLFAKSVDGGHNWVDVRPSGLPTLDIHGFAVDPRRPRTLYAAVAGKGLYRSTDGGVSFRPFSEQVGGAVMALAVTPAGQILAADMQRGLLVSRDGGNSWRLLVRAALMGLALNPKNASRILAAGPGVLVSTDGGRTWRRRLDVPEGAGPVAWSSSNPDLAYVVGFDRTLHRSTDGGETWSPVR